MAVQTVRDLHFAMASPRTMPYTASFGEALIAALPTLVEAKVVVKDAGESRRRFKSGSVQI